MRKFLVFELFCAEFTLGFVSDDYWIAVCECYIELFAVGNE